VEHPHHPGLFCSYILLRNHTLFRCMHMHGEDPSTLIGSANGIARARPRLTNLRLIRDRLIKRIIDGADRDDGHNRLAGGKSGPLFGLIRSSRRCSRLRFASDFLISHSSRTTTIIQQSNVIPRAAHTGSGKPVEPMRHLAAGSVKARGI
jgi:hypothetical protein